jgi:hypothetical protein
MGQRRQSVSSFPSVYWNFSLAGEFRPHLEHASHMTYRLPDHA